MDGFDDLLNPSRAVLEENPFANPFSNRSSSPDPWASPFASTDSAEAAFGSSTHHFASSDSFSSNPYDSETTSLTEPSVPETPHADPLDSAAAENAVDDVNDEAPSKLRSPGFRESLPNFSDTATIRPSYIEEYHEQPEEPVKAAEPITPITSSSSTNTNAPASLPSLDTHEDTSSSKGTSIIASPTSSVPPSATESKYIVSPLQPPSVIQQSFSNLSLGAESFGGSGWQSSEPTPWQAEHPFPVAPSGHAIQTGDDSDDDKPIAQTLKNREHEEGPSGIKTKKDEHAIPPIFVVTVDDPQKVGDPIRGFTMYTVHTRTTSPLFLKSAFSVLRRYSDFLWLYETLSTNNPGVVVPPVPEKSPFGRFDDQFVKQRRLALEKCIQKTANHPVLSKDPDLRLFLESDTFSLDIKHRKAEIALERGGLIASIGQTISGSRFHESDEWFERQKVYLDSLEAQLRGLVKAIEQVSKHRSELAIATGEFAQNVGDLSAADIGRQLSQSLAGLADVERKAQDLQNQQAEQDISTLTATVDEYARLINSVRMAFNSRIRMYHQWKNTESDLLRIKQTHEKNRAQGRIPTDRLGFSLSQIAEAERRAADGKLEFDKVSRLVKDEVARFEQERIEDFKDSLHAFLEGMIARQKELISTWENYQQMLLKKVGGGGVHFNTNTMAESSSSSSLTT